MGYESFLVEVPDVSEALQEVNEKGLKIVSALYIVDSQQVLLIVEGRRSVLKRTGDEEQEE